MKVHNLKLAAMAAAVSAAFAGDASAALTGTYYGAGATAPLNGLQGAILTGANECGGVTANYYENAATTAAAFSGSVFQIECLNASGSLAINYDSSGGSWKGLTIFPALFNAAQADPTASSPNHVTYITSTTGCTSKGTAVHSYSGVTVNLFQGCSNVAATAATTGSPTFGFTDVETQLFKGSNVNQPVLSSAVSTYAYSPTTWELDTNFSADVSGSELAGYPLGVFGIVFGVAASSPLYTAMQTDQLAAGTLPSTCTAGTFSATCAPNISMAQYRSLTQEAASNLNLGTIAQLFTKTVSSNSAIIVARRDQGSGTQATSNNYFFRQGCGNPSAEVPDLLPAIVTDSGTGYTVQYNQTTGGVTGALNSTTNNVIGIVSAEKDGSLTNAGFLKLEGVYPSNTNAALGLYSMVSQEQLHAASNANTTLIADLASSTEAYANTGIVTTFTHGSTWPTLTTATNGNPNESYYGNNNLNCGGWRSY